MSKRLIFQDTKKTKAQIWVETVIYTLIGLTIIGIVLGIISPKIQKTREKVAIQQSITTLNGINSIITDIKYVAGNRWPAELKISSGEMLIDGENDAINITIKTRQLIYSQPDKIIKEGNINILTQKIKRGYQVSLQLNYKGKLDIKTDKTDNKKLLKSASLPYKLAIENIGIDEDSDLAQINFEEI